VAEPGIAVLGQFEDQPAAKLQPLAIVVEHGIAAGAVDDEIPVEIVGRQRDLDPLPAPP
jgi:hypothetical protein